MGTESKQFTVQYDPNKVTLHQLVQTVAETEPVHGTPYQAGVVVTVGDPDKNAAKVKSALKRVKGVADIAPVPNASEPGEIAILFAPLNAKAKATEQVKASQIADALTKAGVKFSGLPSSGPTGGGFGKTEEPDPKRKLPAGKGSAKSKPGSDDTMPEDKSKPSRPLSGGASKDKTKPAHPGDPARKSKDGTAEDTPRFQILAVTGEGVYLSDHEAKLKKLVKQGHKFGDFIVKELGNEDGAFVVLENPETKDTIRVEHERKDKEGDKSKTEKDKESKEEKTKEKDKESGEKEKESEKKESDN